MNYPLLITLGLLTLAFSFVAEAYIIDNTNSTIQYSPLFDLGQLWDRVILPNDTVVFNGTYMESFCYTADNCHVKIPFTGSGITLYNVMYFTFNAKFTVDGRSSKSYIHDNPCYPAYCYNVSTIDVQSLPYGNHILDVKLFTHNHFFSYFALDYAVVNETDLGIAAVTPLNHVLCASLGGLSAFGIVLLAFFCLRKRNHNYSLLPTEMPDHKHNVNPPFDPLPMPQPDILNDKSSTD